MAAVGRTFHQSWSIYCNLALYLHFWTPKWFEIYQERFFFRFFPFLLLFLVPFCQVLENGDCNILAGDGSGFWRPLYWKSPSASLFSSYIKGMSTSVRFRSIIVDCGLGCPTRVSGGFLQSWARADSVVFVHHDSAVWIASLRDCGILPERCAACFISCYILHVLMLCLVLFYVCMLLFIGDVQRTPFRGVDMYSRAHVYTCLHALCLHSIDSPVSVALGFSALAAVLFYLLCESCVFKVYVKFFSLLLCNNVCAR